MKISKLINDHVMRSWGERLRALGVLLVSIMILMASAGCPPDRTPPGNVTTLTATAGDGRVELKWTNPTDSDLAGVKIQRKTGGFPASSTDGTNVFSGSGETFLDTPLDNGTEYYYAVYAYDGAPNYASGAQASATPTAASARADILQGIADLGTAVDAAAALDQAQRDALTAKLGEAEEAYRAGDPCGAATHSQEYLALAQDYRQGTAVPTSEDLYNRGRMLRYNMLAGIPVKDQCPGAERIGLEANAAVNAEDVTQVLTVAAFGEPTVQTILESGETFTQLQVPGTNAGSGDPGAPAVPVFRRLIAAPQGAEVTFDFTTEDAETILMNLYPVQESPVDEIPIDPSMFNDPPFTKNDTVYGTDAFYPPNVCTLTNLGTVRDLPMFLLEVAAGQFNPVTGELKLFKNMHVNVHFAGGQGFLTEEAVGGFDSGSVNAVSTTLNHFSAITSLYIVPDGLPQKKGAEFLILTAPDFHAAADTLAIWKRTKGITTQVIDVGVGTASYLTPVAIRSLIEQHYKSYSPRPSYILLLGDTDRILTYEMPPDYLNSTVGSDWPYALLRPRDPDSTMAPDFAVGRIPAKSLDEANAVVTKIVNYEQTPPNVLAFYNNATIASDFECCRTNVNLPAQVGTDKRWFIETSEFARTVLMSGGKTVQRIYIETWDSDYHHYPTYYDITPRRYYDGTSLPADLLPPFSWSPSPTAIVNAFNAGRFLYIHRDHGAVNQWTFPYFGLSQIDSLTNNDLQPVVFSVNCASGLFDNEQVPGVYGTSPSGVYLAERLLKKSSGGAVGVLGDSRTSPTEGNDALLRGFMDAIWPSAIPGFGTQTSKRRLGDILNHGKLYMVTQCGTNEAKEELHLWHCIGDPTLEIWTSKPQKHSTTISASVLESILRVNYAEEGAMITAFQQDGSDEAAVLGRGVVKGGMAELKLLTVPDSKLPVQLSIDSENAIPIQLSVNLPQ